MKTTETATMNITIDTAAIHTCGCIDFRALVQAYIANSGLAYDIEEIFACACKAAYWMNIRQAQRRGITSGNREYIAHNMLNYLNTPEYVENRIQSNASKVIRKMCRLSMNASRAGLSRVLTCRFYKDERGWFSMHDAVTVVEDLLWAYEQNVGKSLMEKRWREDMNPCAEAK